MKLDEIEKIRKIAQKKLEHELGSKDMEKLRLECANEECCKEKIKTLKSGAIKVLLSREGCGPLRRIQLVLHAYSLLLQQLDVRTWPSKVNLSEILIIKLVDGRNEYGHLQIYEDFHHVNLYHIMADNNAIRAKDRDYDESTEHYHEIAKGLCEYFEAKNDDLSCNCKYANDIKKCVAFRRHYRERNKGITKYMKEEEKRQQREKIIGEQRLYVNTAPDAASQETQPELREDINNEIAFQQECDRIHCFFLQLSENYNQYCISNI